MIQHLGNQLVVEMFDCNRERINDKDFVEKALIGAVRASKATMVQSVIHRFNPHGISGVIVIAESHFAIHTWPEYGYCAVDIFTCGDEVEYYKGLEYLKECFETQNMKVQELKRGLMDSPVELLHKPSHKEVAVNE